MRTVAQRQTELPQRHTPVFQGNLSEEQVFLMQIVNGEIELHDNEEVLVELKKALDL